MTQIIEEIKRYVEEECKKSTSKYGYEIFICHFIPVVEYSRDLAKNFSNVDFEVLEIASWLHDIGSVILGRENHHITGAEIAGNKLRELGYPEEKINKVKLCILSHRGSKDIARASIEEQILADADALSAFDNISGLFKAAIFHEGFNQVDARVEVRRKLINSWHKLSPLAKNKIEHKYLAAMILLGDK
jgi:uncharacterized protein